MITALDNSANTLRCFLSGPRDSGVLAQRQTRKCGNAYGEASASGKNVPTLGGDC